MPDVELARKYEKGNNFVIQWDQASILKDLDGLDLDEECYEDADGNELEDPIIIASEHKSTRVQEAKDFLLAERDWQEYIDRLPKKKNGSFAIGRQITLHDLDAFAYESESHFGTRVPRLQLKTTSDTIAIIEFLWHTRKW